jgi:hypothetical protein
MKLLAYDIGSGPRAGVLDDDRVLDVSTLLGARETVPDVRALLELSDSPLDRLRGALASGMAAPSVPLASARLRAPVLQPPTVRDFFDFEAHASHGRRLRGEPSSAIGARATCSATRARSVSARPRARTSAPRSARSS